MLHELDWITILTSVGIIIATFIFAWLFRRFFNKLILDSTLIVKNDPTNYKFLKHTISALIYVVGFSWAIFVVDSLRVLASTMLAGAGILAVVVGFASQHALSNVISGIFIVLFKPFRVNDRVTFRDTLSGVVEDITLRHTVIRDFQNRRIVIPNTIISNEVLINADFEDEKVCRFVEMSISYDSDIALAKKIMREEAEKHPNCMDMRSEEAIAAGEPIVQVRVLSLGDSSVNLRAWVWALDQAHGFVMQCDLLESIKARFDAEGIEIPFPHRSLVFKNGIPAN